MTHRFNVEMYVPPRYMIAEKESNYDPILTVYADNDRDNPVIFIGKDACRMYEMMTGKKTEFIRKKLFETRQEFPTVENKHVENDKINAPSHYVEGRKYEPRKVIMDWDLNFYLGNAVKYISRAGRKDSVEEDIKKAMKYLEFELERLQEEKR